MPEPKRYEITTLADLERIVTTENVENLTSDLAEYLSYIATMKKLPELATLKTTGKFTWIDDGNTGIKSVQINIKVKDESEVE